MCVYHQIWKCIPKICECCLLHLYALFTLPLPAHNCLRASPAQDHTNGFFVALFDLSRKGNNFLETVEKQVSLASPSPGEVPTSSGHVYPLHVETQPSFQDTPFSSRYMVPLNGDPTPTQGRTDTPPYGHRSASVHQRLGGGTSNRHCKRARCHMRLVLSRRFRHRKVRHSRELFHPSFVLHPKCRCYF